MTSRSSLAGNLLEMQALEPLSRPTGPEALLRSHALGSVCEVPWVHTLSALGVVCVLYFAIEWV